MKMEKLLGFVLKAQFYLVVFLSSVILLYSSVFEGIPLPGNSWMLKVRGAIILPLFVASSVMAVLSFVLAIYSAKQAKPEVKITTPSKSEIEDRIDITFLALSETQKEIVKFIYRLHKTDISLVELHKGLNKKLPGIVDSLDELYFRIVVLGYKELLSTTALESKVTVVTSSPLVGHVLDKRRRIIS
jgi:hypothetical protein